MRLTVPLLSNIFGISPDAAQLLQAAGIQSAHQLARETPAQLHRKLELIVWQRGATTGPSFETVTLWVQSAAAYSPTEAEAMFNENDLPEAVVQDFLPQGPPKSAYGQPPVAPTPEPWHPPASRSVEALGKMDELPSISGLPVALPASGLPAPLPTGTEPRSQGSQFLSFDDYEDGKSTIKPLSRATIKTESATEANNTGGTDESPPPPHLPAEWIESAARGKNSPSGLLEESSIPPRGRLSSAPSWPLRGGLPSSHPSLP